MSRPEGTVPPELFYNDTEAKKYSVSTRMINIQTEITQRALDMLRLPEGKPAYILDIGCGSGLSGNVLQENGHCKSKSAILSGLRLSDFN
jgi:18S rRNA (guanine1575-N7)-methyltransferase